MVNPPKPKDESFEEYQQEISNIYNSLKRRAVKLCTAFNSLEGVSCQPAKVSLQSNLS